MKKLAAIMCFMTLSGFGIVCGMEDENVQLPLPIIFHNTPKLEKQKQNMFKLLQQQKLPTMFHLAEKQRIAPFSRQNLNRKLENAEQQLRKERRQLRKRLKKAEQERRAKHALAIKMWQDRQRQHTEKFKNYNDSARRRLNFED